MSLAQNANYSAVLYAAAAQAIGLVVKTNNPTKARAALYKFRNDVGDPELESLSIRVSPDNSEGEIWILKNLFRPGAHDRQHIGRLQCQKVKIQE